MRNTAYILAVINAAIVGLSFLFTKTAIEASSPLDTLAYRFTVSFLLLGLAVVSGFIKVDLNFKRLRKLLPLTLFYPVMFFSFQAFGLQLSPSSEGGIIFATTPVITMIFAAYFLKEKTNLWQKLSIALSVSGVIFIFVMKGSSIQAGDMAGIALLFVSCASIAGYTVLARALTKTFKPMEITFFMLGIGFIVFNIAAIVAHIQDNSLSAFVRPWTSTEFIISILFLGILASLVTALLSNIILSKIPASQMSVFSNLSTIISIIAGAVILHEEIWYYHIIGSAMIIAGVIGTNLLVTKEDPGTTGKKAS